MSDCRKATLDLERSIKETAAIPGLKHHSVRTYADLGGSDEVHGDGEGTLMHLVIWMRGSLKRSTAREAANAYRKTVAQYPKAIIYVTITGYDSDPREIWDIPEARDHIRYWAQYLGLTHSSDELAAPLVESTSLGTLAKCGVFNDIDPDTVQITPLPSDGRH
jgi:hypothetical protein